MRQVCHIRLCQLDQKRKRDRCAPKDFIVTIAPCDLPGAQLQTPYYIGCDGYTLSLPTSTVPR